MRWPWSKKLTAPVEQEQPVQNSPVKTITKPAETITVEEEDVSMLTRTGVFKKWRRAAGDKDD